MIEVGSYWQCNVTNITYIVVEKYEPIKEGAFIVKRVDRGNSFVLLEKYFFYNYTELTPLMMELL